MTFNKKKFYLLLLHELTMEKIKSIIIKTQKKKKKFTSKVFVTGMHNLKLYGKTIGELKMDKNFWFNCS